MTGLELFRKELLFESTKTDKKSLKIFYKFDINLIKLSEEQPADNSQQQQDAVPPVDTTQAAPVPTPDASAVPPVDTTQAAPVPTPDVSAVPPTPEVQPLPMPSVVTEDDEKTIIDDDNSIVRKMEGELVLQKEEIDEIQTVEDLINKLADSKKDGTNILDEFTSDIITTCLNPNMQQDLKSKVDQKSLIFVEILYGKKKENSVGLRIIKRKNSDLLTVSMMIDDKIINSQYKKETLDKRITDIRNDEFDTDTDN